MDRGIHRNGGGRQGGRKEGRKDLWPSRKFGSIHIWYLGQSLLFLKKILKTSLKKKLDNINKYLKIPHIRSWPRDSNYQYP